MQTWQTSLGIVLRVQPLRERDRLVTLLTEHSGRISGVAKGAIHSRRFGGALDLFTCVEIRYKDSPVAELVRIEEANIRRDFAPLREDLDRLGSAGYFADLCLRLTEERQPAREIFLLLAHFYYLLESSVASLEILRAFEIKLLDRLGYSPNLSQCASCQNALLERSQNGERDYSMSTEKGGFLCENCSTPQMGKIYRASLDLLDRAKQWPIQQLNQLSSSSALLAQAAQINQGFLRFHSPGLSQWRPQNHALLEESLLAAKINATAADKSAQI
jgi:DNA repair protein RecO (recombination protein O)